MGLFSRKPKKLSPDEQRDLDSSLIDEVLRGDTRKVRQLLALGADVHVWDDRALGWAACEGVTETVKVLLAAGASVHANGDCALRAAAYWGNTETVQALAAHIFAADSWRGKSRAAIEGQADALYEKLKTYAPHPIDPEYLREAGMILADCATQCWRQVRPVPPQLNIRPFSAQPKPM